MDVLHLRELEDERRRDVRLLRLRLAAVKKPRLAVVVGKALRANARFVAVFPDGRTSKASRGRLAWRRWVERIRLVGHASLGLRHLHVPVALMVRERTFGCVDGDLVKVRRPEPRKLRVEIRK